MFSAFPEKHRHQGLVEAGDRLFALLNALVRQARGRPVPRHRMLTFVHGLAMLAVDDQLRLHLPGTDDAVLCVVLKPLVDVYAAK